MPNSEHLSSGWRRLATLGSRRVRLVSAASDTDSGAACLAMVLANHGRRIRLSHLRSRLPAAPTTHDLQEAADAFGLRSRMVRLACSSSASQTLGSLPGPYIAIGSDKRFLVIDRVTPAGAEVRDPVAGRRRISGADLTELSFAMMLLLSPASARPIAA